MCSRASFARVKQRAQVESQILKKEFRATVYMSSKHRLTLVQFSRHVDVLHSLSGKHESYRPIFTRLSGQNSIWIAPLQRVESIIQIAANNNSPMIERLPAHVQRVGNVSNVGVMMLLEVLDQVLGGTFQSCRC